MLFESISRNSILLGLFAVTTTAVIAGTFLNTQSAIEENIRNAEKRALLEIVPRDRHDNSMLDDFMPISDDQQLGLRSEKKLYIAKKSGDVVAIIIPVTARDGYTGDIDLIVGINSDGTVAGVRVLSHRETPGLGDKVDYKKSQWVDGFIGKSLLNPLAAQWAVKRDGGEFDQFTGATITPRAVTKAVKQALEYYHAHRGDFIPKQNTEAQDNG